jgi:hypothetical protein
MTILRAMVGAPLLVSLAAALIPGAVAASAELEWFKPSLIGLPPARCSASMVYDPAMSATVLFGGNTYNALYGDTWALSKSSGWTQLSPANSPPPLQGASVAYDFATGTVVLFGGTLVRIPESDGEDSNETWTWDGVTWTQQFPPMSPSARAWNTNAMTYDAKLGKVVMFGGDDNFVFNDETWEWDGVSKTWTQQFPAHSPSPRSGTIAYDGTTNQVILFGGNTNGVAYGDTWTYDGVDWVQHQPATSPQARTDNALAFDPAVKSVVLFGGLAGSCEDCGEARLNDTWLWNGTNWDEVETPSANPEPSSGASFTYDGAIHSMVLFGGWVSDFNFTNTTWLFRFFP